MFIVTYINLEKYKGELFSIKRFFATSCRLEHAKYIDMHYLLFPSYEQIDVCKLSEESPACKLLMFETSSELTCFNLKGIIRYKSLFRELTVQ